MQEALKTIIEFAKTDMNVTKIRACIYPENTASVAIAKKLGFEFKGETKNQPANGVDYIHKIYWLDC